MARPKQSNAITAIVEAYIAQYAPDLQAAPIHIQRLDGPPDGPRYAVSIETCSVRECPFQVALDVEQAGDCPISRCRLRCSLRLLLDRQGTILSARRGSVHWA